MLETGAVAPHFTLLGTDGREYGLPGGAGGEPVVIVFIKTACGACDVAMPYLNRLHKTYPDGGWQLWAIAQEPVAKAREYASRFGAAYPVLIDGPEYEVSFLYDPQSTPAIFLVERSGRTVFDSFGFSKDDLNEASRRIAGYLGVAAVEVAPADDGQPTMKPGCMPRQQMPRRPR